MNKRLSSTTDTSLKKERQQQPKKNRSAQKSIFEDYLGRETAEKQGTLRSISSIGYRSSFTKWTRAPLLEPGHHSNFAWMGIGVHL